MIWNDGLLEFHTILALKFVHLVCFLYKFGCFSLGFTRVHLTLLFIFSLHSFLCHHLQNWSKYVFSFFKFFSFSNKEFYRGDGATFASSCNGSSYYLVESFFLEAKKCVIRNLQTKSRKGLEARPVPPIPRPRVFLVVGKVQLYLVWLHL